ncbi:hypothetical protein C1H46_019852 [Malus baccata]|uniref:Uncharacterized protein n=1 Tax=Malus baccata TaxID=106549 RepID=A0A540M774_MALBA|nr:hypothetical protein C1H46_019852 [Malus baccata]
MGFLEIPFAAVSGELRRLKLPPPSKRRDKSQNMARRRIRENMICPSHFLCCGPLPSKRGMSWTIA